MKATALIHPDSLFPFPCLFLNFFATVLFFRKKSYQNLIVNLLCIFSKKLWNILHSMCFLIISRERQWQLAFFHMLTLKNNKLLSLCKASLIYLFFIQDKSKRWSPWRFLMTEQKNRKEDKLHIERNCSQSCTYVLLHVRV